MKLAVFSHKPTWQSVKSPTGYATDGGFPFQMRVISELCEEMAIIVPVSKHGAQPGEAPLGGPRMRIVSVSPPYGGRGWLRKLAFLLWCFRSTPVIIRELLRADAVHAPIPGDIGTVGMLGAWVLRKRLIVRHCGNWFVPRTPAEQFWRWFMERFAGGRNIMLATGGGPEPPSRNPHVRWIFSTSLSESELASLCRARTVSSLEPRLIIACRQEHAKGTGIVIEALPLLAPDFPGLSLDVLGEGSALDEFRELAKRRNVQQHVRFHGRVDHDRVLTLLSNASVFCYPTRASEGFPKVVLEALACGLPVISTRVSVLPQLLDEGCGVLLDAATPEAVASAVRLCLSDTGQYAAMSHRALQTARRYSLENWRDTLNNLMRSAWGTDAIRA